MKKFLKYQYIWQKKGRIYIIVPLVVTTLIMTIMISVILSNTYYLEKHLEHYTETYANDVAEQLAGRISFQLKQKAQNLESLAMAFSHMPENILTEELIEQKKVNLNVDRLFILNEDGRVFPEKEKADDIKEYIQDDYKIINKARLSFFGENKVVFSTPFFKNGTLRILVSLCTEKTLLNILEDFNYKGDGCCCIVNKQGELVITPSDLTPFQKIYPVFNDRETAEKHKQPIDITLRNIKYEKSGWTVFSDVNAQDLILGYEFLDVSDWILLTIVPLDVLSNTVGGYTDRFILVAVALIATTIFILLVIIKIYRKNMQHIRQAALIDTLTQGDNENAFRIRGEYRLKEHPEQVQAIVYINNKDFRYYNRCLGVSVANGILCSIYETIKAHLDDQELLARCNGTSFSLSLRTNEKEIIIQRLSAIGDAIKKMLQDKYSIENHRFMTGVYLVNAKPYEFIHMLDWARIASTYNTGKECCKIFDDSIAQALRREDELNNSFTQSIEKREFKLFIQPKMEPQANGLIGGEVLVRWEHPKYGLVPPNEFVPLFEKNGNICTLDFYMFEETCKLLQQWIKEGKAIPLSVNLSRAHLSSHNFEFLELFHQLKEQYQIPDKMIELELTESIILERQETQFVLQVIEKIHSMGFACSMDDFGYGYSCLTLLKDLNVNTVKLDRQFFLNENEKSWMVIEQLVRLSHQLNISVVAEGIENWEQVEKLKACDCDAIQGYVYAKPMSIQEFIKWEQKWRN